MSLSGGGLQATKFRVGLSPQSMIRQPNPVEAGFHKKSKGKTSGLALAAPAPRLDPTPRSRINSRQWTLINGALQRNDFVIRRDNRWKQRGYTDPTATMRRTFAAFPAKALGRDPTNPMLSSTASR